MSAIKDLWASVIRKKSKGQSLRQQNIAALVVESASLTTTVLIVGAGMYANSSLSGVPTLNASRLQWSSLLYRLTHWRNRIDRTRLGPGAEGEFVVRFLQPRSLLFVSLLSSRPLFIIFLALIRPVFPISLSKNTTVSMRDRGIGIWVRCGEELPCGLPFPNKLGSSPVRPSRSQRTGRRNEQFELH